MEDSTSNKFIPVGVVLFLILFCALVSWPFKIVQEGNVGVVKTWGAANGTLFEPGFHFKLPFINGVTDIETRVKKDQSDANAGTKDLQSVKVAVAINYQIPKDKAVELYKQIGDDENVKERILDPAVQETVKAVTAKYTAEELLTKRGEVSIQIDTDLKNALSKYNLNVIDVSIVNFEYSKEFDQAVEAKQVAEQRVKQAQFELDKAKKDIEQLRLQKEQLNDQLLMQKWIEKWDGKLPQYVGGDEAGMLIQLPNK